MQGVKVLKVLVLVLVLTFPPVFTLNTVRVRHAQPMRPITYKVWHVSNSTLNVEPELRIFKGNVAQEGQFPFVVFALMNIRLQLSRCTSSLLRPNFVLSAAHCVFDLVYPDDVILVAGKANLQDYINTRTQDFYTSIDETAFGLQERRAGEIFIHPNYDNVNYGHDFSLIKLKEPFILEKFNVKTIAISFDEITSPKPCTIVGWGLVGPKKVSFKLNFADNRIAATTRIGCNSRSSGPYICLRRDVSQMCQGDSGGPLVCDGKVWGVASHFVSPEAGGECGTAVEEFYCEVYADKDWITKTINSGYRSAAVSLNCFLLYFFAVILRGYI